MAEPAMSTAKAELIRLIESATADQVEKALVSLRPTFSSVPQCPEPTPIDIATINDTNFNILEVAQKSGNLGTFMSVSHALVRYHRIQHTLQTDEPTLLSFLHAVGTGYRANSYHNVLHAADVGQSVHAVVMRGGVIEGSGMTAVPLAALFLSAFIHDYGHPGVNNKYLVKTGHELAIRYNDISPLENYHLAQSFSLMQHPRFNILAVLPPSDRHLIRSLMIHNVLATDMDLHLKITEDAKRLKTDPSLLSNQSFIQPILVHFSDIGNVMKPQDVMMQWGKWINEEFFNQIDLERQNCIEPSFSFTRESGNVYKNQKFFIESLTLPLFVPMTEVWPGLRELLDMMHQNVRYLTLNIVA